MSKIPQISDAELDVMKIIWTYAPINTNEVIEKLVSTHSWSPKTVQTMLLRLVKKGALTYTKQSRVFVYSPTIDEGEYRASQSLSFLNRFYSGSLNAMVMNFIDSNQLSMAEIQDLKQMLKERTAKQEDAPQ